MSKILQKLINEIGEDKMEKLLKDILAITTNEEKLLWLLRFSSLLADDKFII